MTLHEATLVGLMIVFAASIHSVFTAQNVCKTYGSGIIETFNKTAFHLRSTCSVTLTRFSHAGVDCHIIVQRGQHGLMDRVEIIVNKVVTLIHNNTLTVEGSRISLPYDHTYQHVFHYGIYTKLKSKVLPLSVIWLNVSNGVSSLWVQLDQGLLEGMSGLCGHQNSSETIQQLIFANILSDGLCLTEDSVEKKNKICENIMSYARECLGTQYATYRTLCLKNMNSFQHQEANCSFFKELSLICGNTSHLWSKWRTISNCSQPQCPGDLRYKEMGPAFPPTCTNPQSYPEYTSTCLPAEGKVLNDRIDGYHSIDVADCPCVHGRITYAPGQERSTKCQTCTCVRGRWTCSANRCPPKCIIEGQFITTFDGKQYSLLERCTYVAAKGLNWTLNIQFSGQAVAIEKAYLNIHQERYTFSANSIKLNNIEITDLSQTEHATVFWQSSMFIQVQTSFGLKMQVQVSSEIQIYVYLPPSEKTKGLCGTFNNDTSDDFTTFSGITESSVQLFAQSWSLDRCSTIPGCINTDNEIYAEENCDKLKDPNGVFAVCHDYVPVSSFVEACVQRTCQCSSALKECLCVAFANYAKACASQGIIVKDWRSASDCLPSCMGNLRFDYSTLACNRTCRSLAGPDPTCEVEDDPVEGCGCTSDTHLSDQRTCNPRPLCSCHHPGGVAPPGPVVIGGRQCMCENGHLQCPKVCDCPVGKICVQCSQIPVNTARRTCESLTKPLSDDINCISGCYCPEGFFEDHNGGCVAHENCTCEFSGKVYATGESVETNCKICTCRGGEWSCIDEACSGVCEVFGNGQYRTFDSKWYRFDGHCQYTLVKDAGSSGHGQFAIKTESVPCCDESLTCSRAISVELLGEVTLMLSDMKVSQQTQPQGGLLAEPLYSIHTVGLYIIISVPRLGLTVIWDKHTRVTIQLESQWRGRVWGLCGNFDGKVTNDLMTSSHSEVFSVLDFGNSWKTAAPPCSDVTQEIFPCERHSYCAAWAQRRCMILRSDTFKDCHLKVDPEPYYQACVLESCSCEFEGKFLGFCTAVAAYAEACSAKDVCINWRTPDLCPVYCDYYNEVGQCSWHYDPCGQVKTCGTNNHFTGKLEGCYPRCPAEMPFYDENTEKCSTLSNCTCNFMNRVLVPGEEVCTPHMCCKCLEGNIFCSTTTTTTSPTTSTSTTSTAQPPTTTVENTTTTQSPTTKKTTKSPTTTREYTTTKQPTTTQVTTHESTTEYTVTTQSPTTETTTKSQPTTMKYTTTTQPPTTRKTTESQPTTREYPTTTQPTTTEHTTQPTTTEHTTQPTTTGHTTQPTTTEHTTQPTTTGHTTQPTTTEHTTQPTTTEHTTQPTTTEHTTQPTTTGHTTQPTTIEHTTQPTTTEHTTQPTTIEHTTQPTTTEYTTQPTTTGHTTQPTTIEHTTQPTTTEYTTQPTTTGHTTQPTTIEHTTQPTTTGHTTQPTTIEHTTQPTTTEHTTQPTTTGHTTQPTTIEHTTQPTTTEHTTQPTTTEHTTQPTTTGHTTQPTTTEHTTQPTTTEHTTQPTTTEYTNYTVTTESPTTEKTTELQPTTSEYTTQLSTTKYTTQQTTTEYTATTEHTTEPNTTDYTFTTQSPTTEKTTKSQPTTREYTTTTTEFTTTIHPSTTTETTKSQPTTTEYTTQPTTREYTTEPNTTDYTVTTESQPTTERTTEYTTTTQPTTTESQPTTREYSTTTHSTTTEYINYTVTTESPTTEKTTESQPTTTKYTTQPTTTEYTDYTVTTGSPTTEKTTESQSTTREYTTQPTTEFTTTIHTSTTTKTTESQPTTNEYTTQPTTTKHTTEPNTTDYTVTTQSPTTTTIEHTTTQPLSPTATTQPPKTTMEYTTTTQSTTKIPTTIPVTTTTEHTTVTTTEFVIITASTTTASTSPQIFNFTTEATTQPPKTTMEYTTTTQSTTKIPTTIPVTTTTEHTTVTTTVPCECKDVLRNQSWACERQWREDCSDKVCTAEGIVVKPIPCPPLQLRTDCPGNKMSLVKDEQTCCESWECDCQCEVYGDPHYVSFQGISFDFLENCTYSLVEETVPRHHLSITVDNYFCEPDTDASCAKGIILKYWSDTITLMVTEEFTVESTLNRKSIKPPYEDQVFRFESSGGQVHVFIKPIRSYVSLTPYNTLLINLATEHFLNNTQGQCGVCGGPSCIRRTGVAEDDNCCDKTAYDWVVEDPLKPYCKSPRTNVPCLLTTTPRISSATPSPTPCYAPICDLLHHPVFEECGKRISLTTVETNCRFDYCLSNSSVGACSSLEYVAAMCKKIDICVDWRHLTSGSCEVKCPEGMIYDECRQSPNDVCQGGVRVPTTSVAGLRSGCFCPDNQVLADEHKQICVFNCTNCKGPLGEPMPVGAVWESNCHICTCNNQTRTEECRPKRPEPAPQCSADSVLVSDCCNNQKCVDKTCEYNGATYKVGARWTDPSRPCESFSCSRSGTEIKRRACPLQTCAEELRVWDKHHCCYSCDFNCAARVTRMNITISDCTQEVELPSCEGRCETQNRWVQFNGTLQLEQDHQCCKESGFQMRELTLTCSKSPTRFTYKHITSCRCKTEG